MIVNDSLRLVTGAFGLLSLALGYALSPYWYLFTAFVGPNLLQSAFSKWCPLISILRRLGIPDPELAGRKR